MKNVIHILLGKPHTLGATVPTFLWSGAKRSDLDLARECALDEYLGVVEFAEIRWHRNSRAAVRRAELAAKSPGVSINEIVSDGIFAESDADFEALTSPPESSKRPLYFAFGAEDSRNTTRPRLLWWGTRRSILDLVRSLAIDQYLGIVAQPVVVWRHNRQAAAKRATAAAMEPGVPLEAFADLSGMQVDSDEQALRLFGPGCGVGADAVAV